MKIYHTETQADYDALMTELEKDGYVWGRSQNLPTQRNHFESFGNRILIYAHSDKTLLTGSPSFAKREYPDIDIIEYKEVTK